VSAASAASAARLQAFLLLGALLGACHGMSQREVREAQAKEAQLRARRMAECEAGTCIAINDNDDRAPLAVWDDTRVPYGWPRVMCTVASRVRRTDGLPIGYTVWFDGNEEDGIVPVAGAMIKVQRCPHARDAEHADEPRGALLLMNPPGYASLAPAPNHVLMSLSDVRWTELEDGVRARAVLESGAAPPDAVRIGLSDGTWLHDVRPGDAFDWGPHRAQIVRVVPWRDHMVGWVEVALR
jgi:hypothetical protein